MAKIVEISTGKPANGPNLEALELLNEAIKMANEGRVSAISIAIVSGDGEVVTARDIKQGASVFALIGAIELLKAEAMREVEIN